MNKNSSSTDKKYGTPKINQNYVYVYVAWYNYIYNIIYIYNHFLYNYKIDVMFFYDDVLHIICQASCFMSDVQGNGAPSKDRPRVV